MHSLRIVCIASTALSLMAAGLGSSRADMRELCNPQRWANLVSRPAKLIAPVSEEASLAQIQAAFLRLQAYGESKGVPMFGAARSEDVRARASVFAVNSKRLVDPADDFRELDTLGTSTKFSLGTIDPYTDSLWLWYRAMGFIGANAQGRPLSSSLLKEVHQAAFEGLPFKGFEGRRIVNRFKRGEISEEEKKRLLKQAYAGKSVSGVDHKSLVGRYRSDPLDQILHRGSSFLTDGRRYFTAEELKQVRSNRWMTINESSVREFEPGKFFADTYFHDVKKIEQAVDQVMRETEFAFLRATTLEEKVAVIVHFQRELISIHPFLDGNGRTVRLLGDLMYVRIGLPPPYRPNEHDLEMTGEELMNYTRKNMAKYLNAWIDQYRVIERPLSPR